LRSVDVAFIYFLLFFLVVFDFAKKSNVDRRLEVNRVGGISFFFGGASHVAFADSIENTAT